MPEPHVLTDEQVEKAKREVVGAMSTDAPGGMAVSLTSPHLSDATRSTLLALIEERRQLRGRLAVTRLVVEHWRDAAFGWGDERMPGKVTAHPLALALAALDGETDPVALGVEEGPTADRLRELAPSKEGSDG